MSSDDHAPINHDEIQDLLAQHKDKMKTALRVCAHCSLCADSCFLYHVHDGDPRYMPSHKIINSIGKLYKKKGKLDRQDLEAIKEIAWRRCVLCTRCYCPLGINIPEMIALARDICRSQDVYFEWSDLEQPAE
jgi:Fe-S oxidoreductase